MKVNSPLAALAAVLSGAGIEESSSSTEYGPFILSSYFNFMTMKSDGVDVGFVLLDFCVLSRV